MASHHVASQVQLQDADAGTRGMCISPRIIAWASTAAYAGGLAFMLKLAANTGTEVHSMECV